MKLRKLIDGSGISMKNCIVAVEKNADILYYGKAQICEYDRQFSLLIFYTNWDLYLTEEKEKVIALFMDKYAGEKYISYKYVKDRISRCEFIMDRY